MRVKIRQSVKMRETLLIKRGEQIAEFVVVVVVVVVIVVVSTAAF